jgi:hypothetical protein
MSLQQFKSETQQNAPCISFRYIMHSETYTNHITIHVNELRQLAAVVTRDNGVGLYRRSKFTSCTKNVQITKPRCFGVYFMRNNIMGVKSQNSLKMQSSILDSKVRIIIMSSKSRY